MFISMFFIQMQAGAPVSNQACRNYSLGSCLAGKVVDEQEMVDGAPGDLRYSRKCSRRRVTGKVIDEPGNVADDPGKSRDHADTALQ